MSKRVNYTQKMNYIKKFVSFSYKHPEKLAPKNKSRITKYYKFLKETEKGFFPVKTTRIKTAQKQLNPEFKKIPGKIKETEFKVIFVPKNLDPNTKIEFEEGKAVFRTPNADLTFIPFDDKAELITNTKEYVSSLVSGLPKETVLTLQTGKSTLANYQQTPPTIADEVERLVNQYVDLSDWLYGINIIKFTNQELPDELIEE